jgi:hypothetical protein
MPTSDAIASACSVTRWRAGSSSSSRSTWPAASSTVAARSAVMPERSARTMAEVTSATIALRVVSMRQPAPSANMAS